APADLSDWSDRTLDLCWVGHATVLVNFFGVHILTDPVLLDRVGAQLGFATVGRKRLISPAIDPRNLPRVDLVLLSHAHMDHLDLPSLRVLAKDIPVVTAPKTSDLVRSCGFSSVRELRWNESVSLQTASGDISVKAIEVKHWGARWRTDTYRGYVGYLLKRGGKTVVFGGDTALTSAFENLECQKVDVAIMPIGSYGHDARTHCTPEQAVRMVDACGANFIVPIHHSTFPIGQEPLHEPLSRLEHAISADRIALKSVGDLWRLPA
ncbi:MAG TPA: MBL fold metallo-hydrolase, partial [Patescibacteria group bacterium]|nr:MBL fold metallo-hydrolase [Patescibacteria group bacterium]